MNNQSKKIKNFNTEQLSIDSKFLENFIVIQNLKTGKVFGKEIDGIIITPLITVSGIGLEPESDTEYQKYILYKLDDGTFNLLQKTSGQSVGVERMEDVTYITLRLFSPVTINFHIINIDNDNFQIRDSALLGYADLYEHNNSLVGYFTKDHGDTNKWTFKTVESFKIPTAPPLETVESFPKYASLTDNLPDETPKRLTGWTKIPAYMVTDHNVDISIKIQKAPYYILEKYQYWKKVNTVSLAPGESRNSTYSTGTNKTIQNSMDHSTNMTIGKDAGLKFGIAKAQSSFGTTADLKQTITNGLDIKESITTDTMTESRETNEQRNPFDKQSMIFSVYQLASEFRYICPSQNEFDPDILVDSWTFIDDNESNITSFPPQAAISAELNKKRNQSHINPSSNAYLHF